MLITSIYIVVACVIGAMVRVAFSIALALFYDAFDSDDVFNERLKFYADNVHGLASPANYLMQGIFFVWVFTLTHNINPSYELNILVPKSLCAFFIAVGQSTLGSHDWQKWINRGNGRPDYDPNENHMSEFKIGHFSFWYSTLKVFNGKKSRWLILLGSLLIVTGINIMNLYIYQ